MGFVGSHTARYFSSLGYWVIGVDRVCTIPSARCWLNQLVQEDFVTAVPKIVGEQDIDLIIHCAGTSLVGPSMLNPGEYYDNNVAKTNQMLETLTKQLNWAGTLIFSSSAAVYGAPSEIPIPESHILNPISPYGSSKMFTEILIRDHCVASGMRAVALRYFNAAGAEPRYQLGHVQDDTHMIPRVFEAYYSGKRFHINGDKFDTPDGTCIRDYVHATDIASAHHAAAELAKTLGTSEFRAYNLGTGAGFSNLEVVSACEQFLKRDIDAELGAARPGDPARLVAQSMKFQTDSGWRPEYSSIENLVATAGTWHRNQYCN
jgi:UDP-glucose-4-epimerase GalE